MIEMRVIDRGFYGMEYQYRYYILGIDASGGFCPSNEWSDWKTAPVLKEEEIEND